jgi:hypothetical protein
MFKGNIYFALPLNRAADLFTCFEQAVEQGLFSHPSEQDGRLYYFDDQKSAVEFGRLAYAGNGQPVPGALNQSPVFAVVHIGPIAPMGLAQHVQSTTDILGARLNVLEQSAVARVAQIVRNGAFAYNAVNMSIKLFTL